MEPAGVDRPRCERHDVMDFLDLSLAPRTGIKVKVPSKTGPSGPVTPISSRAVHASVGTTS